jgi:PilZ domain
MADQRTNRRPRTFKGGSISFDRTASCDCLIRNLSAKGACLEVESPAWIPDKFTLTIKPECLTRKCHVMWRTAHKIGVHFV